MRTLILACAFLALAYAARRQEVRYQSGVHEKNHEEVDDLIDEIVKGKG